MERYNYLIKKYKELDLIRIDENDNEDVIVHTGAKNFDGAKLFFDPHIYPDTGSIPFCSVCSGQYNDFLMNPVKELKWLHMSCGCLWADYFMNKVKEVEPQIVFSR
jgi:hypothetical protein